MRQQSSSALMSLILHGREAAKDCGRISVGGASSSENESSNTPTASTQQARQLLSTALLSAAGRQKCPHCEYLAVDSITMANHQNMVHTDVKTYSCPRCAYQSRWKGNLKGHIYRMHPGILWNVYDN